MTTGPMPDPAGDPAGFLGRLADRLQAAGLGDALTVDRRRSVADRLSGRPGEVGAVRVRIQDRVLTLGLEGGRLQAGAVHEVRGVVLSRRALPVGEWLDLLTDLLGDRAGHLVGDGAVATQALVELGLADRTATVRVDPADVAGGLAALPALVGPELPADVAATLQDVCSLLRLTLTRLPAGTAQADLLRRTAVDYLPTTLRGYLALPPEWAATRPVDGDRTALDLLRQQLALLQQAAVSMHDAAVSSDADALLANGYFLAERFGRSSLDG